MRSTRLYLDNRLVPGTEVELDERGAHHVARVLRMKPGAPLQLFDGRGNEADAYLASVEKRRVSARIEALLDRNAESPLRLVLGQGISRGERMDFTLQKSVELGVTRIVPLWTEHSQVQLDEKRLEKRMEHWRGVIISACEQSGRNVLPELAAPVRLSEWVAELNGEELGLLLDPLQSASLAELSPPVGMVRLLVGPEGGLSDGEAGCAREAGFVGVRLGPRILRTETAALATLAALQALWGDFR
ncbi:MAG TPA: 16S rRNA (uracil(1498)-N(3))-methyltransferase [Gammaproteobacteria bacterium]|nr:16S rRNA (uracil(1498)-N(3))-methyltransferase [Gammaproteobacteria bacterium]